MKSGKMVLVAALGVAGLLLGDSAPAAAQGEPPPTAWVARYSGQTNINRATAVAVDGSGNVYVTGTSGTIKYDPEGNELWVARGGVALAVDGQGNVYVTGGNMTAKYDADGNQLWDARYGGSARALAVDDSGNVYVTGTVAVSRQEGANDYATVKYDADGNEVWAAHYDGYEGPFNAYDAARAIAVDASGNVYVTGNSQGLGTGTDYATIKYSPEGAEVWVRRHSSGNDFVEQARALALDGTGNVYVTGYSSGDSTIKYSTEGEQLWIARYRGPGNRSDFANALAVDASGNVYVTGYSATSGFNSIEYATVKYDAGGNQMWAARYGEPADRNRAYALALDGAGNVYVTGESRESGIGSDLDYATIKYSPEGEQLWAARYNRSGNGNEAARALAVDAAGNVYVTGIENFIGGGGVELGGNYATIKYAAAPSAPAAPTGLAARAVSGTQIDLAWADNAGDEKGFVIERWDEARGKYREVARVGADVTGFRDTDLEPGATYRYRVRAVNRVGSSAPSNEASATTQGDS